MLNQHCQFKFKNGTLCGTNSYNAQYCDGHMIIILQDELAASKAQSAQLATALYAVAGCSDRTIEGDVLVFRSVMEQVSTALTAWQQANK
jgi:hypothetical protein